MGERDSVRYGQAEAIATLIGRTETVTLAPSLRSFKRIVPRTPYIRASALARREGAAQLLPHHR
jgi:hypothetical protein